MMRAWPPCANPDEREALLERMVWAGLDDGWPLLISDGITESYAHEMNPEHIRRYWYIRFGIEIPLTCLRVH